MSMGAMMDASSNRTFFEQQRRMEAFNSEIGSINEIINHLKHQFDQFHKADYISSSHLSPLKKDFSDSIKNIFAELAIFSKKLQEISERLSQFSRENSQKSNDLQRLISRIEKVEEDSRVISKNLLISLSENHSSALKSIKESRESLLSSVEKVRQEFVCSPKSVLESNEMVSKKVEMAQLDSQNAMLKLGNLETQFRIFERKVDNLDIRLKKIELSQQN